jgi:hypothetical protein
MVFEKFLQCMQMIPPDKLGLNDFTTLYMA